MTAQPVEVTVPLWALDAVLTIPVAGPTLTEAFRALHAARDALIAPARASS